jgi:hypothetical protein
MADLSFRFSGVNTEKLADEVARLRKDSPTFRALEAAAAASGYTTIEIAMAPKLVDWTIASSSKVDPTTRRISIN